MARQAIKTIKLDLPPVAIKSIKLRGYNLISITDRSFTPAFKSRIRIYRLQLNNIDTQRLKLKTGFLLKGKLGRYTRFRFIGDTRPFTRNVNLKIHGNIRQLILRKLSPYTERYYGYELTSGHLDASFKLNINNSRLSGRNRITLRRLGLKNARGYKSRKPKLKLPVEAVVKLLSNSRNEIKIVVPNTGNLNDPNFSFGINYQKAFESAFKRGVVLALKYTQPVGQAFTLFSSAKRLLTSIRMKPVRFRGGSSYLSFRSRWSLRKVAKILHKKKKITLRLCAFYTNTDIEYFQVESGRRRKSRSWAKRKAVKLSMQRALKVKNYLIRKHKIYSGRLFLCKPGFDKRDSKHPRIRFSI